LHKAGSAPTLDFSLAMFFAGRSRQSVTPTNATPNPRVNRLLLKKLREWRFFPAMRDGKPAPLDQDVRITFEVK
jgi:outer membrane biosynthesis protein TonB